MSPAADLKWDADALLTQKCAATCVNDQDGTAMYGPPRPVQTDVHMKQCLADQWALAIT